MSSAAAAQRSTILPSRQRQTFRVLRRTPLCGLSITLVETRQRERLGDNPKRFTVNISAQAFPQARRRTGVLSLQPFGLLLDPHHAFLRRQSKGCPQDSFHLLFQLGQVTHYV